jgi:exonuclease VII large subunit
VAAAYDKSEALSLIKNMANRLNRIVPEAVYARQAHVQQLVKELNRAVSNRLMQKKTALSGIMAMLEKRSPHNRWASGMAFVRNEDGGPVTSAAGLSAGQRLRLSWADGEAETEVVNVWK